VVLGLAAVLTHLAPRLVGQPVSLGALAAAQVGVPVAAATLGTKTHLLADGEPAALILGALVTIAVASAAGSLATRITVPSPAPASPGPAPAANRPE
jgi:hypothetical protein